MFESSPRSESGVAVNKLVRAVLLHQLRDQGCPAGLMTGTNPSPIIAVEIFVKRNKVAPVRICLKLLHSAEHRPPAVLILLKDLDQPLGNFPGNLPKIEHAAGSRRAL